MDKHPVLGVGAADVRLCFLAASPCTPRALTRDHASKPPAWWVALPYRSALVARTSLYFYLLADPLLSQEKNSQLHR
jgi:hypothetical protein